LAGLAAPVVFAARREPGAKFLLAWVVPPWIVFELVVTKLPHYVLPLYPAIAILIAGSINGRVLPSKRWLERGTIWWFIVPILLGLAGIGASIVIGHRFNFLAWLVIAAAVIMGFRAWQLYRSDGPEHAMLRGAASSVLLAAAIFGLVVPSLRAVFPSMTIARVVRDSGCVAPQVAAAGYGEDSVVFLVGTATRHTDGAGAAEFLRGGPCRFAIVEGRDERSFVQRAEAIGVRYSSGPRFDGFNIGNGRAITIAIYRSQGSQ
jgi:4-amino-4-deoxy-L-arabinose transferase-like glycosyltransferase